MEKKITAMYFSPTGTTQKAVTGIARQLSARMNHDGDPNVFDFTLPEGRRQQAIFSKNDLVVLGVPVIAGRIPNVLLKYLNSMAGHGALAVAVVCYGNRNYDDALIELTDILGTTGFNVVAGGAFIGEHSFSKILASNRPDAEDMAIVGSFANQIVDKIHKQGALGAAGEPINVKGVRPYRNYYVPKNPQNEPVDIRKVAPKTNELCTDCKLCAAVCPMGSIDYDDVSKYKGICIKCGACVKKCPVSAKYYDDENYLRHQYELEADYAARREPELFV